MTIVALLNDTISTPKKGTKECPIKSIRSGDHYFPNCNFYLKMLEGAEMLLLK